MKKYIAGLGLGVALAFTAPSTAEAQANNGLVAIQVGDVTILEEVNVAVIANVLATVCASVPVNVALIAALVDQRGINPVVCRTEGGQRVRLTQDT